MSSRYTPTVGNKVCAYTLKNERDLPPGKKLLMCSKCKETFYENRDAQLSHWPDHKRSCCAIEKDPTLPSQEYSDPHECMRDVSSILHAAETRIIGRGLLHALKCFLAFMKNMVFEVDDPNDEESYWKGLIDDCFQATFEAAKLRTNGAVIDWIWGIPGFVNFFLDERNYICTQHGYHLIPGDEQPAHPRFTGPYFGSFFILTKETIAGVDRMSYINSNTVAIGWMRFLMKIWGIDDIRQSVPLYFRNQVFNQTFLLLLLGKQENESRVVQNTKPGEIVPGLTLRNIIKVMIDDMFTFTHNPVIWPREEDDHHSYWDEVSRYLSDLSVDPADHGYLSTDSRLDLIEILHASPLYQDKLNYAEYGAFDVYEETFYVAFYIFHMLIISPRISHLLDMYYLAKDSSNARPQKVIAPLEVLRNRLLDEYRSSTQLWTNCVLYKARRQNIDLQPSLPADVLDLITEFSLPAVSLRHFEYTPTANMYPDDDDFFPTPHVVFEHIQNPLMYIDLGIIPDHVANVLNSQHEG
jgi:hypothetical protein